MNNFRVQAEGKRPLDWVVGGDKEIGSNGCNVRSLCERARGRRLDQEPDGLVDTAQKER